MRNDMINWKFDKEVNLMYTNDLPGRNWFVMFIKDDLFIVNNEASESHWEFSSIKKAFRAVETVAAWGVYPKTIKYPEFE